MTRAEAASQHMLTDDERAMLADWARHPGAEVARRWLIDLRKAEEAALGAQLYQNAASFDPVVVAEKAGRHHGRMEVLNHAFFAAKAMERQAKQSEVE